MGDFSSEKKIGMRLELPASWNKKLNILAAEAGEAKGGARTEVMKAVAAWIKEPWPPKKKASRDSSVPHKKPGPNDEILHRPHRQGPGAIRPTMGGGGS